jgi:hypothetical protein
LERGYASSISLPLLCGSQAFGALSLYAPETDAFNQSTAEQYTDLANNLAFGVMALRMRSERTQAENEIRQLNASLEKRVADRTIELGRSEQKFRALFEGTSQAVVLHDEKGILEANPRAGYGFSAIPAWPMSSADMPSNSLHRFSPAARGQRSSRPGTLPAHSPPAASDSNGRFCAATAASCRWRFFLPAFNSAIGN